jgi:hypothetical protein
VDVLGWVVSTRRVRRKVLDEDNFPTAAHPLSTIRSDHFSWLQIKNKSKAAVTGSRPRSAGTPGASVWEREPAASSTLATGSHFLRKWSVLDPATDRRRNA